MKTRLGYGFSRRLLFPLALGPLLFLGACTGAKSFDSSALKEPTPRDSIDAKIDAKALALPRACVSEDLAMFDHQSGEKINLANETLPHGLYLATVSDMLLEKQNAVGAPTRLWVREIPGEGGVVVCNENLAGLGHDFQMSVTGLVKFDTTLNPQGAGFTARQFYVFAEKNSQGIVLSHPTFSQPLELNKLIKRHGSVVHVSRLGEKAYLMTFTRRRADARIRLFVHLEQVSK